MEALLQAGNFFLEYLNTTLFKTNTFVGVDPNIPSKKGVTPISAAAHKGNIQLMQLLIEAGATVNSANASGSTALIQVTLSHFSFIFILIMKTPL